MKRLASNAAIYGLGSMASQALAIVLLPLYTNYLAPAEYGVLALIGVSGAVLTVLAGLGIQSGLVRIYFLYDTPEERGSVATTALVFGAAASLAVATALLALGGRFAPALLEVPESVAYWNLAVAIYCASAFRSVGMATLQIAERARVFVACNLAGLVVMLGLTLYLVMVAERGVRGVLEAQLAGTLVEMGLALAASFPVLSPRLHGPALRSMLAFAVPLIPTNLAALGIGLSDRYFLREWSGVAEVGIYAIGFRLGSILDVLCVRPFATAWSPYMFSIAGQPGHREAYARTLHWFALGGAALVVAAGLYAAPLLRFMSSAEYWRADALVFWVALGCLVRGMSFIVVAGIHVTRKSAHSSWIYALGLLANLALLAALVPAFGGFGAALAVLGTYLAVTGGMAAVAQRLYPVPYDFVRVGLVLAFATAVYVLARLLPETPWPVDLALRTAVFAAFLAALRGFGWVSSADVERGWGLVGDARRRVREALR